MENAFEFLRSSIPSDHSRQSRAIDVVRTRMRSGFHARNVLDLGCGDGRSLDHFRSIQSSIDWVGVDIEDSPEVSQRSRTDGRFVTYNGVDLPFNDGEFDLIYSHQVFEHVRHPEALLREVSRVLSVNGLFIGQTSQLEPFHSYSFWNFTCYGFKIICKDAGLDLIELRPGIDGITLIERSYLGRPPEYSKWFKDESPLNTKIEEGAIKAGKKVQIRNYRKLIYAGHFVFACGKSAGETGAAPR